MAVVASITAGAPVNLELGGAYVDLGAEDRNGQRIIVLAADDGNGFAQLQLSPEDADLLADVLHGLAAASRIRI